LEKDSKSIIDSFTEKVNKDKELYDIKKSVNKDIDKIADNVFKSADKKKIDKKESVEDKKAETEEAKAKESKVEKAKANEAKAEVAKKPENDKAKAKKADSEPKVGKAEVKEKKAPARVKEEAKAHEDDNKNKDTKSVSKSIEAPTEEIKPLAKIDVASSKDINKMANVLQDSYNVLIERQNEFSNSIESMQDVIKSFNTEVLPLMKRVAEALPAVGETDLSFDSNPEDVATKSLELEAKQQEDSIKKSVEADDNDIIAKSANSATVDEVVNESVDKSSIKTQTEKIDTSAISQDDLALAARGYVGKFFDRMKNDVHKGAILENDINKYQKMIADVNTNQASEQELTSFIQYAQGK
jgi:hypothetical protein